MPIRVSNLRLGVDASELALADELARALDLPPGEIQSWRILRKSLDARDKRDITFVYSAEVTTPTDEAQLVARAKERARVRSSPVQAELYAEEPFALPTCGAQELKHPPVVIGSGPAGLAAALFLAQSGYQPIVLERGRAVRDRIRDVADFEAGGPLNTESNYLFGEGGAGTFSDGKLTCRLSGPDVRRILELFANSKGKPSLLYEHRPHLGSNRLPAVVKSLRQQIERAGGTFRFECRAEDLDLADGRLRGVATSSGYIPAELAVLAVGHSARDTYQMLFDRGLPMTPKAFQFGVRIEQPQEQVNRAQYGPQRLEEKLGAADYSLVAHGRLDVFTFCMCAGGQVIPSVSEPGYFATNGMSLSKRNSPFANSGLMATLGPEHFGSRHTLAGMHLQREFEKLAFEAGRGEYLCPIQLAGDFLARKKSKGTIATSYLRGVVPVDLASVLPVAAVGALRDGLPQLDRKWRGQFLPNATLVGPESRGSSPVRIERDRQTYECPGVAGIYPIGEGAGYAGGIVSAAVDGLRAAKAIIARYAPLRG